MVGTPYLPEEDEAILVLRGEKLVEQPWTWEKIGTIMGRSKDGVQQRHGHLPRQKVPQVTRSRASRRADKERGLLDRLLARLRGAG